MPQNSGSAGSYIVYAARPGDTVTILLIFGRDPSRDLSALSTLQGVIA